MDPCHRIRNILSAYQDNEVEAVQKAAIEAHLRTCESCRRHYEILQQTYQLLNRLPEVEADESLSIKILERVSLSRQSFWIRVKDNWLRLLPVPATMMAMVFSGILLGALVGHFWIEQQALSHRTVANSQSNLAFAIASQKAFDAVPAGSFTQGYLQLAAYKPEHGHAK
jgi:anti-sigma factor RsiW